MKLSDLTRRTKDLAEDPRRFLPDERIVNNGLVGVEVEVEGYRVPAFFNPTELYYWHKEKDGSLRNEGMEFKTKVPLTGADLAEALQELYSHLHDGNTTTNFRTGLHVHLDCRDLKTYQISGLSSLYYVFEDALFVYADRHRKHSNFCPSIEYSARTITCLGDIMSEGGRSLLTVSENWPKYSALNLHALGSIGTVEFRQHPGTFQPEEIARWVNILLSMKEYVKTRNWVQFLDNLYDYTGRELLHLVFGNFAGSLDYYDLDRDCDRRLRQVRALNCRSNLQELVLNKETRENSLFYQLYGNTTRRDSLRINPPFGVRSLDDDLLIFDENILNDTMYFLYDRDFEADIREYDDGIFDIVSMPNGTYISQEDYDEAIDWATEYVRQQEDMF